MDEGEAVVLYLDFMKAFDKPTQTSYPQTQKSRSEHSDYLVDRKFSRKTHTNSDRLCSGHNSAAKQMRVAFHREQLLKTKCAILFETTTEHKSQQQGNCIWNA